MVGYILNGKVGPATRNQRSQLKTTVKCRDNTKQSCEKVVNIGRVKVVFRVVGGVSRPRVDSRIMGLCGIRHAVFVVGHGVSLECRLVERGGYEGATTGLSQLRKCVEVDCCGEWPRLALPKLEERLYQLALIQ